MEDQHLIEILESYGVSLIDMMQKLSENNEKLHYSNFNGTTVEELDDLNFEVFYSSIISNVPMDKELIRDDSNQQSELMSILEIK